MGISQQEADRIYREALKQEQQRREDVAKSQTALRDLFKVRLVKAA